jgi:6,7-dimethyl-8-ribityllumazine synthase
MSAPESWPGDKPDNGEVEDQVEPAEREAAEAYPEEDTGEEPPRDGGAPDAEAAAAPEPEPRDDAQPELRLAGHAPGELDIPEDVSALEGEPRNPRRGIAIVAARFNGDVTNRLLESALAELDRLGVGRAMVTVTAVPGAFELPLGAMALAKTRRFACVIALGCVIRGETAHFDYVAGEAASGLQLAALETGVPVAFGVLTVDTLEQAMARADKGAEAVRTALEMADLFSELRASSQGQ